MVKRAWLYLIRKYKRSALLMLLLFVVSFSISIGLSMWNGINTVTKEIEQNLGTSINFRLPKAALQDSSYSKSVPGKDGSTYVTYDGPKLNWDIVTQILEQVDGITDYNIEDMRIVHADNISLVSGLYHSVIGIDADDPIERQIDEIYMRVVNAYGNEDTSLHSKFRTGAFELVEGRHITHGDTQKVLISDELAQLNQLQIGDSISLSHRAGQLRLEPFSDVMGEPQTLEIVGIFHVNGYQPTGDWVAESDITYNWIFTDMDTTWNLESSSDQALYENKVSEERYENVTFFVDDPAQLPDVLDQIKNLDSIDTQYYDIAIDDTMYKSTVDPLNSIRNLVVGLVLAIVLGCTVVLCIVFTMWVRSRRQEIAVYLSMGISKAAILGQFVLEAGLVALLAGVLSFAVCQQVPDLIGNQMLASTIEAAQPEVKEPTREEIHQAAQSGTVNELFTYESSAYAGPEHIDFTFRAADFAILLLLELLLITAAICKAGWFIFELQPRQIMTTLR